MGSCNVVAFASGVSPVCNVVASAPDVATASEETAASTFNDDDDEDEDVDVDAGIANAC